MISKKGRFQLHDVAAYPLGNAYFIIISMLYLDSEVNVPKSNVDLGNDIDVYGCTKTQGTLCSVHDLPRLDENNCLFG
jgi:hypothetical protein